MALLLVMHRDLQSTASLDISTARLKTSAYVSTQGFFVGTCLAGKVTTSRRSCDRSARSRRALRWQVVASSTHHCPPTRSLAITPLDDRSAAWPLRLHRAELIHLTCHHTDIHEEKGGLAVQDWTASALLRKMKTSPLSPTRLNSRRGSVECSRSLSTALRIICRVMPWSFSRITTRMRMRSSKL